nr:protein phosphatase 1 regulatory subunit 12C-like [Aegilops tauschii subsp. strangulata]
MEPPRSPARFTVRGKMLNMIFQAASDGDIPRFKSLLVRLDSGRGRLKETVEALRVKDAGLLEGLGALHVAACRERLEVCRYLIEELQVDVNGVDKGGNGEAVKLLLAKGAYVDPVASCGTPLHCAASKGHDDIMKILLGHNADCNKLVNGKSPLNTATDANSKNCMLLLLKAGADRKGAAAYAAEKLQSEKVVSTEFVNCIMGDVAANRILPDDLSILIIQDESESKRKIRVSGFQKLASFSFKGEEYHSAAMSYTVVY